MNPHSDNRQSNNLYYRPLNPGSASGGFQSQYHTNRNQLGPIDSNSNFHPPQRFHSNIPPPNMSQPPPVPATGFLVPPAAINHPPPLTHSNLMPAQLPPPSPRFIHPRNDCSNNSGNGNWIESEQGNAGNDIDWLNKWLHSRGYEQRKPCLGVRKPQLSDPFTVPVARGLLKRSLVLLNALKSSDSSQCKPIIQELDFLKACLSPDKINILKMKMARSSKKRERLKQKRREDYEEKLRIEEKRKQKHEALDKWRDAIEQKANDAKKERELKASADSTFMEVRKKLADVSKFDEILKALTKLRKIRIEKHAQKGLSVSSDGKDAFESRLASLNELIQSHRQSYETERKTLEVMLEAEEDENEEKEEKTAKKRLLAVDRYERNIKKHLFGPRSRPSVDDPIAPFTQYYLSSETDAQTFIHRRHEWDSFLVPADVPGASSLPLSWVEPSEPSTAAWRSILQSVEKE